MKATFRLTIEVDFDDNGEDDVADQAWEALREKLPSDLDIEGEMIGKVTP